MYSEARNDLAELSSCFGEIEVRDKVRDEIETGVSDVPAAIEETGQK